MPFRYTKTTMLLHWLIALLIFGTFGLGIIMVNIPGLTPAKLKYFSWHKWLGVTVLGLSCLRLLWRLSHPAPVHPPSIPHWQQRAASILHGVLYFLLLAVPVSGYFYTLAAGVPVVYLGIWPLPVLIAPDPQLKIVLKQVHFLFTMLLLGSFVLHFLAALKHHFIDRDGIFKRISPFTD
jgi:cytochrome b561